MNPEELADLQVGDWVTVTAQVIGVSPLCHEVAIELFSKTDQYQSLVRADLATKIPPPATALPCTHLWERGDGLLARCELHDAHAGHHQRGELSWASEHTRAYAEDAS